jgi:hypothetical protein
MNIQRSFVSLATLLALGIGVYGAQAQPATPVFNVSASNVTMSSSGKNGTGSSTFTLTSMDGYTGTVGITCYPTSEPAGAKIPYCGGSLPPVGYTLKANATVTGSLSFYNVPVPVMPAASKVSPAHAGATGLALAGAILLGFGFRRKAGRWLVMILLATGMLTGLAAISGCGGGNSVVTPGTYSYTVQGVDTHSVIVTSTFQVTVP